jgi:pyruvate dehydrogenase E2 component (dihydrolipoamide acetyltransferase)
VADFLMPSLGADMEAGTLVEWLVKPGDKVKRGDVVAVVETQKGAIEIETFQPGQVEQILVELNHKVPVGTPLARIRVEGEAPGAPLPTVQAAPAGRAVVPAAAPVAAPVVAPPAPGVAPPAAFGAASPAARKLAHERDIDLATIKGSGTAGAITIADVEKRIAEAAAVPEKKRAIGLDLPAMRVAIAAAMARSKREIPHYYLAHHVDVSAGEQWLARKNAILPPDSRILMGALTIKAVALAVHSHPGFNGFYRDDKFVPSPAVHVGVAIAIRGGGLASPALHDADQLPLDELMARLRDLIQRTRAGRIRSSEMSDSTITASSLGERGVGELFGIIYPPQVAIVGFGKVETRPWVVEGAIAPRPMMTITLSGDHRVTDGHAGALFLAQIGKLLQEPDKL